MSNVDYTYCSKINNERSCLDHLLLSDNLFNIICQYECKHDGDNLSDHDPIIMSLDLPVDYINEHLIWDKATEDDLLVYKDNFDKQLELIEIPHEILKCANNNCNSHDSAIESFHNDIINACLIADSSRLPQSDTGDRVVANVVLQTWC